MFGKQRTENWVKKADYRAEMKASAPEELFLIVDRVCTHFDWDEQVRMRVQMNHLDVFLW